MPVTFAVASHPAKPVQHTGSPHDDVANIEREVISGFHRRSDVYNSISGPRPLGSSFSNSAAANRSNTVEHDPEPNDRPPTLTTHGNGFLHAVIAAYSSHHHLTISPDDVWIGILTQFSLYVNANSEELRAHFVAHEGQQELHAKNWPIGGTEAMRKFAEEMAQNIRNKVADPDLADWILPDFSTTTSNETIVCTAIMMATLKAYFKYSSGACCGIPLITLEGEKADWESILARIDKLPSFGQEPTQWALLLRPVLRRFVEAFEAVEADRPVDTSFWGAICDKRNGSGFFTLSGWITAFCAWNQDGKWRAGNPSILSSKGTGRRRGIGSHQDLVLDGARFPSISMSELPRGYTDVDIELNDNGHKFTATLVAGHLACEIAGEKIRPKACWVLAEKMRGGGDR